MLLDIQRFRMLTVCFVLLLVRSVKSLMNASDCSRVFPADGTWLEDKPFWKINGCSSNAFDMNSTSECLSGRTIYVIGISTARQLVFSLSSLMGDVSVDRLHQKSLCPRNVMWYGGECFRQVKGVKIKFKYLDFMDGFNYSQRGGFPFLFQKNNTALFRNANEAAEFYGDPAPFSKDLDREDVRASLNSFLNTSMSNDILIFNLGMIYASESKIIDYPAWLISSAKAWRNHVTATFKGKVFRITLSEVHREWEYKNHLLNLTNYILRDVWNQKESREWYTIDQWAINKGRKSLYNDRIHFEGLLTDASLQIILNILCPKHGISINFPVKFPTTTEITNKLLVVNTGGKFVVDNGGYLHQFPNNSSCFQMLRNSGSLNVTDSLVALLPKGSNVVEVCKNLSLIQQLGDKYVHIMAGDKMQKIATRYDFVSRGFDFTNVVKVPEWEFSILPQ